MKNGDQNQDDSIRGQTMAYLSPYISIAKAVVLPYVIVGGVALFALAKVYPKAAVVVAVILVAVVLVAVFGFLYLRRRIEHAMIARRADKQTKAHVRGKEKGVYGKFKPEKLE